MALMICVTVMNQLTIEILTGIDVVAEPLWLPENHVFTLFVRILTNIEVL